MTNRDAINLLEEVKILDDTMYAYNPSYLEALDMAITALEAEETWYVTHEYPPKTRWIPVSERLPEESETRELLLCWDDGQIVVGGYIGNRTFVGQAWPEAASKATKVIAWMPKPKPYKEQV